MAAASIKPGLKAVKAYYDVVAEYAGQQITHEGATETAFQRLLADTGRAHGWMLVPKLSMRVGGKTVIPDGTLRDEFDLGPPQRHKRNRSALSSQVSSLCLNPPQHC
jgi:hypothetical protein